MEHVVQVILADGGRSATAELKRFQEAIAARLGKNGETRCATTRDAESAHRMLVASKARFGIQTVRSHECRHQEGDGDCSSAVTVED